MSSAPPHHRSVQTTPKALVRASVFVAALATALITAPSVEANEAIDAASPNTLQKIERNLRDLSDRAIAGASEISNIALSLIGVDYKYGGNTPEQGLDCSGFVRYVFQQATGINLPRTSREQAKMGKVVDKTQLQPGDLVFFNTRRFQFSHVGVYLGDNRFVHSPSKGGGVEIVNLDNKYWQKAFNGARRVLGVVAGSPAIAATLPAAEKNVLSVVETNRNALELSAQPAPAPAAAPSATREVWYRSASDN
jgi:cell wall-associated NlpC family hydrolase